MEEDYGKEIPKDGTTSSVPVLNLAVVEATVSQNVETKSKNLTEKYQN